MCVNTSKQKKNNFRITHEKRTLIKKKTVRKSHSRHGFLIWLGLVLARSTLGHLVVHLDQACQSDLHFEQPFFIPNCGMLGAGSWDGRNTALLHRRWLPLTRRPATSTWGWGLLDAWKTSPKEELYKNQQMNPPWNWVKLNGQKLSQVRIQVKNIFFFNSKFSITEAKIKINHSWTHLICPRGGCHCRLPAQRWFLSKANVNKSIKSWKSRTKDPIFLIVVLSIGTFLTSKNTWSLSPSSWSVIKKKMNEWTSYFSFFRQWSWLYQRASWSCRHEDPAFYSYSAPAWNSPNPKPASWHSASQRNESAKWTLPCQWQAAPGRSSCIDAPGIRETRT